MTYKAASLSSLVLLLALAGGTVPGCGVEIGNPVSPTGTGTDKGDGIAGYIADNDTMGAIIAGQLNNAAAAASETYAYEAAELFLLQDPAPWTLSEECTSDDATHLVHTRSLQGNFEREVGRGALTRVRKDSVDDEMTATWESDSSNLACRGDRKPRIDFSKLSTLKAIIAFSKVRSRTITLKQSGRLLDSGKVTTTGERHVKFAKDEATLTQTISQEVKRTTEITSRRLGELKLESQLSTPEPFVITTTFGAPFEGWQTRNITNGSIRAVQPNGTISEITYTNVVIERAEGCQPTSGNIAGKILANAEDNTPSRSFTVAYNEGTATVTFNNGESVSFDPEVCIE